MKNLKFLSGVLFLSMIAYAAIEHGNLTVKGNLTVNGTSGVATINSTQVNADNVRIDGNTLSTTNTNGDFTIDLNGTGSTILNDLTASRALALDANKKIISSTVTSTELGYLSGVTSAIQTQLDALSAATAIPTGALMPYMGTTAPTGWVLADGKTIGSASSGATGRANADTEDLFIQIWNSCADAQCAVSSGRGANGAADFAANKTIVLPDLRGRVPVGKDDLGGSAASRMTSGGSGVAGNTIGASGGAQTHTLTTSEMPSHTHEQRAGDGSNHVFSTIAGSFAGRDWYGLAANLSNRAMQITAATGGGGAHNNTQPSYIVGYVIKL